MKTCALKRYILDRFQMDSVRFKVAMEFSVIITSSMIIILIAIIPNVSPRPTESTVTDADIKLRKRPTVDDFRHSIRELEQIEGYYQQLLIRGYLPESDVRRLELLTEFIDQLKNRLQTLLNTNNNS